MEASTPPVRAPINAALADARLEGRRHPQIGSALRHHIHMALQHEAAPDLIARTVRGYDRLATLITD